MLRANSRLNNILGQSGVQFIEHAAGSIQRILPHVDVSHWTEAAWQVPGSVWTSTARREIRITIGIGDNGSSNARSLNAVVRRRQVSAIGGNARGTLDTREYDICSQIAGRISEVIQHVPIAVSEQSMQAILNSFDESVIAQHIQYHHDLQMSVSSLLFALHTLSEQTYENKSLVFGCLLDPSTKAAPTTMQFPDSFFASKKYKALSDGFRTAYHVSTNGRLLNFLDLDSDTWNRLTERHYFPDWAEPMARVSRSGNCGIALTRQGDILVFDEGALRLTYRYGRWQYWNHSHVVNLLRDRARAQRVPPNIVGRVVGAIYRAALDISFRRSGGLFVILHNRTSLHDLVREGDAITSHGRGDIDREFDAVVENHKIQALPRPVAVELASLDGAVVLENSGKILAYGAILQPKKSGRLHGSEGSRTKAAIGASKYGLAVKISADGDIVVYHNGGEFLRI